MGCGFESQDRGDSRHAARQRGASDPTPTKWEAFAIALGTFSKRFAIAFTTTDENGDMAEARRTRRLLFVCVCTYDVRVGI